MSSNTGMEVCVHACMSSQNTQLKSYRHSALRKDSDELNSSQRQELCKHFTFSFQTTENKKPQKDTNVPSVSTPF